ncbi:MAG: hypothetical protein ACE144_06090 [Thermodesulfobacteriota bacterium]
MKIVGILLIAGILFSYIPMVSMDDCRQADHSGNMKLDCGYVFHCPVLSVTSFSESIPLPYFGLAVSLSSSLVIEEIARSIFHPPERGADKIFYLSLWG